MGAIRRVVEGEADPIMALEVVTVATHRGKTAPNIPQRRKPEQSPLEALALGLLTKKLEEDPTDALERILDRRERLEEAADRLTGRRGRDDEDGSSGNAMIDALRVAVNSPLGEAIGSVLGAQAQARMTAAAAASGQPFGSPVEASPAVDTGGAGEPLEAMVSAPAPPPLAAPQPRPVSFRVGMAIRTLKAMSPQHGARWILGMADQHPQVDELLPAFIAAEPDDVPNVLEAYIAEAATDPHAAEWVPLVGHLRANLEWTLACHAALRELTAEADDDDADDVDQDAS